jgi:RNA polymerase sigma-70 factor, ECF subfamily
LQTEQQLLRSFADGDDNAIVLLVARYEDKLYNLCRKLACNRFEAEELYQQTWLKVLQKSKSYTHQSFQNWLYTLCLNTYRDTYRKNLRRSKHTAEDMNEALMENSCPVGSAESEALNSISQVTLTSRINALPDRFRIPILLHYFEDLDYNEVARLLGIPVGTVKSRLNTAKQKLRTEMESNEDV